MSYTVVKTLSGNIKVYGDGRRSCIGRDSEFQQWLRANKDNLPDDIQAEVDAGRLVIEEEDI